MAWRTATLDSVPCIHYDGNDDDDDNDDYKLILK